MSHILELHHLSGSMASKSTFDGFLMFLEAILAAGHESMMVKVDHHGLVFMDKRLIRHLDLNLQCTSLYL